jgi:elongation factor P
MISTSDLKKGVTIELEGQLYQIVDYQHLKLGRGTAQVRVKLRDIRAGHTTERTFQAGERFPQARLDYRSMQYLYQDGELYYFMDTDNFEQISLEASHLGDALTYLKEGMSLEVFFHKDSPLGVVLPTAVELTVAETGPSFKGDTATGGTKPATLETGLTVQVPLFVNTGDRIKVDTRTGEYLERA